MFAIDRLYRERKRSADIAHGCLELIEEHFKSVEEEGLKGLAGPCYMCKVAPKMSELQESTAEETRNASRRAATRVRVIEKQLYLCS